MERGGRLRVLFLSLFIGIFFVLPCIEQYQKVDLRTITLGVPPQEVFFLFCVIKEKMLQSHDVFPFVIYSQVLTKDSVTVSVDAVVYYRVSNATVSVANVENAHHSTRLLAQTTLRNILGTKNLHEILSDRESISGSMQVRIFHIVFCTPYLTYACMHKKLAGCVKRNVVQHITKNLFLPSLLRRFWTRPRRPGGSRSREWKCE